MIHVGSGKTADGTFASRRLERRAENAKELLYRIRQPDGTVGQAILVSILRSVRIPK